MSIFDKLTESALENVAFGLRRITAALIQAGLDPAQYVTGEQLGACNDLMGWFPEPATMEEGGEDA